MNYEYEGAKEFESIAKELEIKREHERRYAY